MIPIINIENKVFNDAAELLRDRHTGIYVYGEYIDTPAKFPCVTIVEADNRVLQSRRTAERLETAASLMYEVNIYSNKTSGKAAEAKAIMETVDDYFSSLGFTRMYRNQIPNLNNATIYRIVARYEGVAIPNDDGKIYIYTGD